MGPGIDGVRSFAYSNDDWQEAFVKAWTVATTNNFFTLDFSCKPETGTGID